MPFEPQFPSDYAWLFHGHMQSKVTDPQGQPASTILSMEDSFRLKVSWQLHGTLVPVLCGNWHVTAYLESIGPGPELSIALPPVDIEMGKSTYDYEFPIDPKATGLQKGPYKLVTVITSTNRHGKPTPFAAYDEGPILQFYPGESLEGV